MTNKYVRKYTTNQDKFTAMSCVGKINHSCNDHQLVMLKVYCMYRNEALGFKYINNQEECEGFQYVYLKTKRDFSQNMSKTKFLMVNWLSSAWEHHSFIYIRKSNTPSYM